MTKHHRSPETKLRYARAEIRALREELEARREAGNRMSNILYNLSQGIEYGEPCWDQIRKYWQAWDAIKSVPEGK